MRDFFEDLKQKAPLLLIISLILSIVLGGAICRSVADAKAAGDTKLLAAAITNSFGNITNFSFFTGVFAEFLLFLKITGVILLVVFGMYAYSRYKGAKNTGDNSTRGDSLIDIKRILSEYTKVKAQSSKQRIPKGIKNSLQENFANKKIDEEGLEYLENIYQNHTVYFR